jgi:hypothetical protein
MAIAWQVREPADNADIPWLELDISKVDPGDGTPIPRVFITRFESSSPDCEDFIHDPLNALIRAQDNDKILDVDENPVYDLKIATGWRVTTLVVNHQNTLSKTHLIASASIDDSESTVGLTLVKKQKPGS